LVGAKPAKLALPRSAEVLPVTIRAPELRASMAGTSRCAKWSSATVLISKFLVRTSAVISA
jgi:hypothetical protein